MASGKEIEKAKSALDLANESYDFLEKIWKKLNVGDPIATTVTYVYPKSLMETTRIYKIPARRRKIPRTKIVLPAGRNFQILNILDLDTGIDYADISVRREEGKVILDPKKLPSSSERFMIKTVNQIDRSLLDALVDVRVSEVASREEKDKDKHWIVAAIKDEGLLRSFYKHVTLEDVDIGVGINVHRHYSTVLKADDNPLIRLMRANQKIFQGIDRNRRGLESWGKLSRKTILKEMKKQKEDIFTVLSRLCLPRFFRNYISLDNPSFVYMDSRRSESLMTLGKIIMPIPSGINVTVGTTLKLEEPAQKGHLIFDRGSFCLDIEKVLKKYFKF